MRKQNQILSILIWLNFRQPSYTKYVASLVAQTVKNPPAMQDTLVLSLGQKDPLEKGLVTHSSIFNWRILWTGEPGRLQSMGSQNVGLTEQLT